MTKIFLRSESFFLWLGIPGIFLYVMAMISGAFPLFGENEAAMSVAALTVILSLFTRNTVKIIAIATGAFLLSLLGGISFWAHGIGFVSAAYVMAFVYTRFIKHHAAVADTLLIGLGLYVWIVVTGVVENIGVWAGFWDVPIAWALVANMILGVVPIIFIISAVLIIIANYSKYGSLLRP